MFDDWPSECRLIAERLRPLLCRHGAAFRNVNIPKQVRVGWSTGGRRNPWVALLTWAPGGFVELKLRVSRHSGFVGPELPLKPSPDRSSDSERDTGIIRLSSVFPAELTTWIENAFQHCADRYGINLDGNEEGICPVKDEACCARELAAEPRIAGRRLGNSGTSSRNATELEARRSRLIIAIKSLPENMREQLRDLKANAVALRQRSDLIWYLLLQSAATRLNSRGWEGLIGDEVTLKSVAYSVLSPLTLQTRQAQILAALRKAKVRMPTVKAPQLARNVARIAEMGGVEQATQRMLGLQTREEKLRFMRSFDGVGEKYGRNVWMDIYDVSFRESIAVDSRLSTTTLGLLPSATWQVADGDADCS